MKKLSVILMLLIMSIPLAQSDETFEYVPETASYELHVDSKMDKEVDCLAKNIYYEARGEGKKGMEAVAVVTLNRVNHPAFPSSVCGVVHQRTKHTCQFSWYCQKWVQRQHKNEDAWREANNIAVNMLLFDAKPNIMLNHTALYYHATYVNPYWVKSKKRIARIGKHVFYTEKNEQYAELKKLDNVENKNIILAQR